MLVSDAAPVIGDVREGLRLLLGGLRAGLGVGKPDTSRQRSGEKISETRRGNGWAVVAFMASA